MKINPIFNITNPIEKIETMKEVMIETVEFMDGFGFFDDEDISCEDIMEIIKDGRKVVGAYVVDKIVSNAYDADILQREGVTYEEAMIIAKYLILKEEV